jgi:hypothetical protein
VGATGLEHPCKRGGFVGRGPHRGPHGTSTPDTFERFRPVDLAVAKERVRVPVGGDDLRALADAVADVGPRDAGEVQERDTGAASVTVPARAE